MKLDDADGATPISRSDARAIGLPRYYTGKACRRGHLYYRNVKNGTCLMCASQRLREARKADPEKFREAIRRKYATDPEFVRKVLQRSKRWREENRERALKRAMDYQKKNFTRLSLYWKEWRQANKERKKALDAAWHKAHPESARAQTAKRRARLAAAPGRYTAGDIKTLHQMQRRRCAYCRTKLQKGFHADHIMPLAMGGTNEPRNIQLLCPPCNLKKNAQHPIDFAQQRGLLL